MNISNIEKLYHYLETIPNIHCKLYYEQNSILINDIECEQILAFVFARNNTFYISDDCILMPTMTNDVHMLSKELFNFLKSNNIREKYNFINIRYDIYSIDIESIDFTPEQFLDVWNKYVTVWKYLCEKSRDLNC